jgi:hypothetical protein
MGIVTIVRQSAIDNLRKKEEDIQYLGAIQAEMRKLSLIIDTFGYKGIRIYRYDLGAKGPQIMLAKHQGKTICGFVHRHSDNFSGQNWYDDFIAGRIPFLQMAELSDLADMKFESRSTLQMFQSWLVDAWSGTSIQRPVFEFLENNKHEN